MMNKTFDSIKQGLDEAILFAKKKESGAKIHKLNALDVKSIRTNINLSQSEFSQAFGISVNTLRHWEKGDRKPQGAALSLLHIVARAPEMALKALRE